jgi:hypothetical protein
MDIIKIQALTPQGNIELIFDGYIPLNSWLNAKPSTTVINHINIKEEK